MSLDPQCDHSTWFRTNSPPLGRSMDPNSDKYGAQQPSSWLGHPVPPQSPQLIPPRSSEVVTPHFCCALPRRRCRSSTKKCRTDTNATDPQIGDHKHLCDLVMPSEGSEGTGYSSWPSFVFGRTRRRAVCCTWASDHRFVHRSMFLRHVGWRSKRRRSRRLRRSKPDRRPAFRPSLDPTAGPNVRTQRPDPMCRASPGPSPLETAWSTARSHPKRRAERFHRGHRGRRGLMDRSSSVSMNSFQRLSDLIG